MANTNPYYKPRIGNLVAGILLGAVALNGGVMVAESFTVVGEVAAETQAIAQDVGLTVCFVFLGVYGTQKKSQQAIITMAASAVELIPYLNDLPVGLIEVALVVYISRKEDHALADAKLAAAIEEQKEREEEQRQVEARAAEVEQRLRAEQSGRRFG
jgi:hypothetical protein